MKKCPFCAEDIQDAAIVCKHCGRDLPKGPQAKTIGGVVVDEGFQGKGTPTARGAQTPPQSATAQPTKPSNAAVGCLTLGGIVAFLIFIAALVNPSDTPENKEAAAEQTCSDTSMAFYMSHEFVKKRLRAPATAQFPGAHDDGVAVRYLGDCTHDVVAFVDSQNGFGALVRSKYTAKLKNIKGTDEWRALSVEILDQ